MMEKLQERRGEINSKDCTKPLVKDLNQHLVCPLCRGYLIDAITLVECLHSFCRGCIVQRFGESPKTCPQCNTIAVAPLVSDVALQRLVYLVVPGLFRKEQERRRNFRKINPNCSNQTPLGAPELSFDDLVSLSLSEIGSTNDEGSTRYLKCPAGVTVRHLLRLLMLKRGWDNNDGNNQCGNNKIDIIYDASKNGKKKETQLVDLSWTLMDLACIFEWKREAPMKLLYRVVRVDEIPNNKTLGNFCSSNMTAEASSPAIENIPRPPTPPPSPKPTTIYRGGDSLTKNPRPTIVASVDQYDSKKPRCEVSPLMRAPDPPPIHDRSKSNKLAKLEHKRKKRKNKRVIAEITTTPREDLLKLKVRLTPVPTRVSSSDGSHSKDKLLQMRAVRKDKTKNMDIQKHKIAKEHKVSLKIDEELKILPEKEVSISESSEVQKLSISEKPLESQKQSASKVEEEKPIPEKEKSEEADEPPKNEEVLRRLGLVAISEANKTRQEKSKNCVQSNAEKVDPAAEREKLEKQLRESKANRVRSLLAEKQMRDTLKSMMSNTKDTPNSSTVTSVVPRCETPTTSSNLKRKEPPPLTPLRNAKRPNVTFALGSFTSGKTESPLDLRCPPSNALDLSSNVSDSSTTTTINLEHKPVSILRNSSNRTSSDKPKDETKKPQESNLKTLSDAAVSLLGTKPTPQIDKSIKLTPPNFIASTSIGGPMIGGKVALRIPQPHQRLTGFGMKIKPSIGVRHIPNPQAVVASQYRNQRTGYFSLAHQPP